MIPNNLPYRTYPRDWVDEQPTWYQYIIGQFGSEMWWERDEINKARMEATGYQEIPFDEDLTHLHEKFLIPVKASRINDEYEPGILPTEMGYSTEPLFHPDTQCRFDIWALYNQSTMEVELDIGGAARIKILPNQQEISDTPPLQETVPSEVPLIFGSRLHTPLSEPSIPHRPFVQNNPQIRNFIHMKLRLDKQYEKKKRLQRQLEQHPRKQREKYPNARRRYAQHQRKQRQKKQRSRRRARCGRGVPQRVLNS